MLTQYLKKFPSSKIVVVGDVMLDDYLWGRVSRISPEAPVPIVEVGDESFRLGGAANVAHNIAALDGAATICGVVGDDDTGRQLASLLAERGIDTTGLVTDASRPTTIKTRVIAHQQQMVRVDREVRTPIDAGVQRRVLSSVERCVKEIQCLVISDYAKGVITEGLAKDLVQLARRHGVKVIADPKVTNFDYMAGATVATPNHLEAMQIAGRHQVSADDFTAMGQHLLERFKGEALLITRGEEGMSLFERDGRVTAIPTFARQVYDVTGAGDTVAAALAMGLAAGAPMVESARLANIAAGVVVGIVGTATLGRLELQHAIDRMRPST
jgi:D-glycero-beta-D-manno-heptose-7-phosphate kinase